MYDAMKVAPMFAIEGTPVKCELYGCGHINDTYRVFCDNGNIYTLQRINSRVFPNVKGLMNNIVSVTAFLREKVLAEGGNPERDCLQVIPLKNGDWYLRDGDDYWRMLIYIDDAITLQTPEEPHDFYHAGCAFGKFQQMLSDFPADTLCEVIEGFHNTRMRFEQLEKAIAENKSGRVADVADEIAFAREREADCSVLIDMLANGELPLRVTHNDTKLNNVLLDPVTKEPVAVVDLDTVMPGLSLYDFGDSIRFGASSAAEDEADLDKVYFCMDLFEAYTKGYMEAVAKIITPAEAKSLALGALVITYEQGIRFLGDYLNGDVYFKVHREGQNLDRARTQFKLVKEMEERMDEMQAIVDKYYQLAK